MTITTTVRYDPDDGAPYVVLKLGGTQPRVNLTMREVQDLYAQLSVILTHLTGAST